MNSVCNMYALLISVDNYEDPDIVDLKSNQMDLALMGQSLLEGLKISKDNIRMIGQNGRATIHNLARAMKDFSSMLKKEDTFIFYFSGHGSNGELIFSDHSIGLQSVINYIEKLPSKNKILILDSCYAGSFSGMQPKTLNLEDSIESFVGSGTAGMWNIRRNRSSQSFAVTLVEPFISISKNIKHTNR